MQTETAPKTEKPVEVAQKLVAVEIPLEEITGGAHPRIQINRDIYEPGQTYMVTPSRKAGIEDRIKVHAQACIRITQGRKISNVNAVASSDKRLQ